MKNDMVEKKRLFVDGEELQGLISIDEYPIEKGSAQIPSFNKVVEVVNGVVTIPLVNATFKISRDSKTMRILKDWFEDGSTKDCVLVRTDGSGKEFARELWPNTELKKNHSGAYDGAEPTTAMQLVTFAPEDIKQIDPEG